MKLLLTFLFIKDCSNADLSASPVCQSTRTTSTDPSTKDVNLQTWMCSNSTSAALYDYFPFVCVQVYYYNSKKNGNILLLF